MKILHVLKSNIYSGAENVVCSIITNMPEEENIYLAPEGPIVGILEDRGIQHVTIPSLTPKSLRRAIQDIEPDIIHAHDFTAGVICAISCGRDLPIVSHLHNNPPWIASRNWKTVSYLMASRRFAGILAVSDAVRDEFVFRDRLKCPVTVVGNPFSVESVKSRAGQAPRTEVLFTGRLTEQKDPLMVLRTAECLKDREDISFRIVGAGELEDECRTYIQEHGLHHVSMEGFSSTPYAYMSNSRIQMMPSRWEGFGLVALEAMSFGNPVLCSGEGGLKDIVDATCGSICHTPEEYAEQITSLLDDADRYQILSAGAEARAMLYNNMGQYIETIQSVYEQAIG